MRAGGMELSFLTNQKLSDRQAEFLLAAEDPAHPILFSVIGEIDRKNRYETTAVAVCGDRLFTCDLETGEAGEPLLFSDIEEIYTKRLYGNDGGMHRLLYTGQADFAGDSRANF